MSDELLQDIRTILQNSTLTALSGIEDKFIAIGRGKALGHPHIKITVDSFDVSGILEEVTVMVTVVTSGRNMDSYQVTETVSLVSEVTDELLSKANRRTSSNWLLVNDLKVSYQRDNNSSKLLLGRVKVSYKDGDG